MSGYKEYNRGRKVKGKDGKYLYSSEFCSIGGSDGYIYKNSVAFYEPWRYKNKDEIVYIPEYGFPDGKWDRVAEDDVESKYTRQSLIALTNSEVLASELFDELSWQHPESLWNEWCVDSDKSDYWIERRWAYEKVYLPEFADGVDRTGQAPVCYQEFSDVEWQDEEYRKYCLNKLVELGVTTKENVSKIMETEME